MGKHKTVFVKILEPNSRVVDNHIIVGNARALVFFSNLTESIEEQTVTELHDIRLVHAGHFLKS